MREETIIELASDDRIDFWEVFGEPFEPGPDDPNFDPGLDETRPPILTVRILHPHPHAGDPEVTVYPVIDGGMAYFDAGPEYRWMRAPAGTDIEAWVAAVKAATTKAAEEMTTAVLETIADECRAGIFPVIEAPDEGSPMWGLFKEMFSAGLSGEPVVIDGLVVVKARCVHDGGGHVSLVGPVVRLADGRLAWFDDEESSWRASAAAVSEVDTETWLTALRAAAG